MTVKDIDQSVFDDEVLKSNIPVVIDLWAEWCGPCRIYSPIFEELSKNYEEKIKFVRLNVDDNPIIAEKYNIMSIPTTLLIIDGKVKAMQVGAMPKDMVKKWIDNNINKKY
ncbi:MAG: thioredoxin [Candidatus Marsarchaeota archaeon]|jgi:thioredoxin 1|nr:thioredoxin [Candidatus Marsarchaeota archaeon]